MTTPSADVDGTRRTAGGIDQRHVASLGLGSAVRQAAADFYYNSWRLVPANLAWAAGLLLLLLGGAGNPLLALALSPLLAFPTFGLFRMAGLIHRGNGVSWGDSLSAWRAMWPRILVLGVAVVGAAIVFVTNAAVGILRQDVVGIAIATAAAWGLLAMVILGAIVWPLAADPDRADRPFREIVKLAALLAFGFPIRFAALSLLLLIVLAVSTALFVALLTVGIAFVALVATRYVLPAADRLEARPDPALR